MKQGPVFQVDYYDGMETCHYLGILIPKFIIFMLLESLWIRVNLSGENFTVARCVCVCVCVCVCFASSIGTGKVLCLPGH
jgi:hypothetical protein